MSSNFEDIHTAVNLWLHPHQCPAFNQLNTFEDVLNCFNDNDHSDMLFVNMLKMLYHALDFLAIKVNFVLY